MLTVKILTTGEKRQVTRNEAHDLIERGVAVIAGKRVSYPDKSMKPNYKKGYVIK